MLDESDLDGARANARDRFDGEPDRRFGILASSKAKKLVKLGLDPGFQATKRIQVGRWFNDGPESAHSCCRLETVITEFQCQGLELDLPIVCWGDDFRRFYPYISDLSYAAAPSDPAAMAALQANMPGFGARYDLPLAEMQALDLPVVNIGPFGKDAHRFTERLETEYSFHVLPRLVAKAIGKLLG